VPRSSTQVSCATRGVNDRLVAAGRQLDIPVLPVHDRVIVGRGRYLASRHAGHMIPQLCGGGAPLSPARQAGRIGNFQRDTREAAGDISDIARHGSSRLRKQEERYPCMDASAAAAISPRELLRADPDGECGTGGRKLRSLGTWDWWCPQRIGVCPKLCHA
jgi:hypothetical protein